MAFNLNRGWTAASLLPTIASGFSPGAAWSGIAPAQVNGNPASQQAALAQSQAANRTQLKSRILTGGKPNPAVNTISKQGYGL